MNEDRPGRIYRQFTPEERARWEKARDEALALRPQLIEKGRRLRDASREPTFSGALRSAIHRHVKPLPVIASEAGVAVSELDEFLTGERTLRSDAIDRLAKTLGFDFPPETLPPTLKSMPPELTSPPIIDPTSLIPTSAPSSNI
jgi:hypothetical protein